ncbi:MAG: InlB B-repeat-containing protein [Actinomycetes bacterium]|jgi:uncharacterized repeat protein (TIGR02543 family)|nr:InlB B-repeat-containing protein [Actinomycetes bacterium]
MQAPKAPHTRSALKATVKTGTHADPGLTHRTKRYFGTTWTGDGFSVAAISALGLAVVLIVIGLLTGCSNTQFTLEFDINGGEELVPAEAERTVTEGRPLGPLPQARREGFDFQGWYTARTSGIPVSADTEAQPAVNLLFARWKPQVFKLTFDPQGGNLQEQQRDVPTAEHFGALPKPTGGNGTFVGWYTEPEGGTSVSISTPMPANDLTVYAHWKDKLTADEKALLGEWELKEATDTILLTFNKDHTYSRYLVIWRNTANETSSRLDIWVSGNFTAEDGHITYANATTRTSEDGGASWSNPHPAEDWPRGYKLETRDKKQYLLVADSITPTDDNYSSRYTRTW